MSSISGVGASGGTTYFAAVAKPQPKPAQPSATPASGGGSDPDHDGDTHGGGINTQA